MNAEPSFAERELPAGMLEYELRSAIRNVIRLYGFEDARELAAMYFNDEATRRSVIVEHHKEKSNAA